MIKDAIISSGRGLNPSSWNMLFQWQRSQKDNFRAKSISGRTSKEGKTAVLTSNNRVARACGIMVQTNFHGGL